MNFRAPALLFALLLAAACGEPATDSTPDAGAGDDAGHTLPDAGDADGGPDAGVSDAGPDGGEDLVVWPNAESRANSDAWLMENHARVERLRPRILVVNFVNARTPEQIRTKAEAVVAALRESSRWHGYADPEAPAMLEPEILEVVDLRDDPVPAGWSLDNSTLYPREDPVTGTWGMDYGRLFEPEYTELLGIDDPDRPGEHLSLCALFERGFVHEVWLVGGGGADAAAAEILSHKPVYDEARNRVEGAWDRCAGNGCFDQDDEVPCGVTVRIAFMNETRGVGCFLESLSHGFESMAAWRPDVLPSLSRHFIPFSGHDLDVRWGLPEPSWYRGCEYGADCLSYLTPTSVAWDFGDGRSGVVEGYDAVCGNVHFPPNARKHYDIRSPAWVRSSCTHFRDGSGETALLGSDAWMAPYGELAPDCDGPWLVWWSQNFPALGHDAVEDDGTPLLSWWPYLYY